MEFMIKQVIVMRKDLKMRRGKEIAQGAHASMAFFTNKIHNYPQYDNQIFSHKLSIEEFEWIKGKFTKICLQVDSEEELQTIYDAAKAGGFTVHMITDSGLTEFNGVPTKTCLAIGPNIAEDIDKLTGHLKLY
jgi:PTH2 family peptidyl-tRNA hydrolase